MSTAPSTMSLLDLRSKLLELRSKVAGRSALRSKRGFTAVELMVAMSASLVVCAAAYTLARSSLDVFQQEARMNAAQFSNVVGMNRMLTDIKRAGFMASPDARSFPGDPEMCAPAQADIAKLVVAVNVTEGANGTYTTVGNATNTPAYPGHPAEATTSNNRKPDRLRLAANYATSERFKLGNVDMTSNLASLDVDQLPIQRIFRDKVKGGPDICDMFPTNGIARIVDNAGKYRFARVAGCLAPDNVPKTNYLNILVTLAAIPNGPGCGEATGGYINPVNIIDYAAVHMQGVVATAQGFGPALEAITNEDINNGTAGITGDASRMMLIRRRLTDTGGIVPNSAEMIADYVADLNFSASVANTPLTPGVLTPVAFGAVGGQPANRIRKLGVRFSTRARNPDRSNRGVSAIPNENVALQRFEVFQAAVTVKNRFARVRTLFTEVSVSNLQGKTPW